MLQSYNLISGELAEWSKAVVLKTIDPRGSGGSNPSLSAKLKKGAFWPLFSISDVCRVRTPAGFDKIVGNDFEQRRLSDAGPEGVRRRDAPNNPEVQEA